MFLKSVIVSRLLLFLIAFRLSRSYTERVFNIISPYFSDNNISITDENQVCRHRYVGDLYQTIDTVDPRYRPKIHRFANLPLDTCRRLCSDLKTQIRCGGFSYDKDRYSCTIIGIPEAKRFIPEDAVTVKYSNSEAYFHKVPCETENTKDNYSIIGNGLIINGADRHFWEKSKWIENFTAFMNIAAHLQNDLIHECKWKGNRCDPDAFTSSFTDFGKCYTFNAWKENGNNTNYRTSRIGSTFGLKLIINVEEYEYMPGPYNDAGIKVFLHPPDEIPMVRDLGFAVPPGRHSLIAVRSSVLENEKHPIGKCGDKKLRYFDKYSWFRCQRDCETELLENECGCKAMYMVSPETGNDTVCNMTHYFTCVLKKLGNYDAAKRADDCRFQCTEPCYRTIYEPQTSNAALSSLSIERILRTNFETLKYKYMRAVNIQHRVQENAFVVTAENLLDVHERYDSFLHSARNRTSGFQDNLIKPVVNALTRLINMFKFDMNRIVFRGLNRAMTQVDIVFGPNKDTMDFFIGRVVRNSKLVSLHVNNLVQYGYRFHGLNELLNDTIQYASVVETSLPRHYEMLTDVPLTMKRLGFDFDVFIFPPQRLAKVSNECQKNVDRFTNGTKNIKIDLTDILDKLQAWGSNDDAVGVGATLKNLYIKLHQYESRFELLEDNCFDQFIDAVQEVREFNDSYQEEINVHTDIEYTFDFENEAVDVFDGRKSFEWIVVQYLELSKINKTVLQENLTEDWLNELIATERDFISKVKFRLTERLRRRMDKARADVTDWYLNMVKRAMAMSDYMSSNFLERRISQMRIWDAPSAVVFGTDQLENTYSINTTNWKLSDYVSNKSLIALEEIIFNAFIPINEALDTYDDELGEMQQDLSTALKQVRNLMSSYRARDEMDERYVLKNFLQMDVYFSELKIQKIVQMPAYSIEDLFSDVGGYMGLLLGASAVTVFEVLDLIIYNVILKCVSGINPGMADEIKYKTDKGIRNNFQENGTFYEGYENGHTIREESYGDNFLDKYDKFIGFTYETDP